MLRIRELTHRFDRATVLRGLSLDLPPGRLTALVGPNGAGKTTLIRLAAGLIVPSEGTVTLDDPSQPTSEGDARETPTHRLPPRKRAERAAYVPQRPDLAFAYDTRAAVAFGLYAARTNRATRPQAIRQALERVGLSERASDPVGTLSAGQQQRAALARALVQIGVVPKPDQTDRAPIEPHAPSRWLFADEPTSALDPAHAIETLALLRGLARSGLGVLVSLHDLSLAARFADNAVVLDSRGALAASGDAEHALDPEVLGSVFGIPFARLESPAGPALVPGIPLASPSVGPSRLVEPPRPGSH